MTTAIETRVALVEKEVSAVVGMFGKYDIAIEKLVDVSSSLKQLLAVHDNRLQEREKADFAIFDLIERRKEEYSRGVDRVHQKMDEMSTEIKSQVRDELNTQHRELRETLTRFEDNQKQVLGKLETSQKEIATAIDQRINAAVKERDRKLEKVEDRIQSLERWRWAIMGGGLVIGFLIGKADLIGKLFGLT